MIKVKKSELVEMVSKAVQGQLNEQIGFMAMRSVLNSARDTSFQFEREIIKLLDLEDPDLMDISQQKIFHSIVKQMEKEIVKSVANAIVSIRRANLPKKQEQVDGIQYK